MAIALGCSESCRDIRIPIKLSSGCSTERYLMRQRYLRSYPLMMAVDGEEKPKQKKTTEEIWNMATRTKKGSKRKQSKYYYCRLNDDQIQGNNNYKKKKTDDGDKKSKPHKLGSYYVKACLKMLLVCVAKVKVDATMENRKTAF